MIAFLWLHDTASSHPSDIRVRVCIKMPSIVKKRVTFKNVEDKHEDKRDKAADVLNLLSQLDREIDEDLADVEFYNMIQFVVILSAMTTVAYLALSFLSFSVVALLFAFGLITLFKRPSLDKLPDSPNGTIF